MNNHDKQVDLTQQFCEREKRSFYHKPRKHNTKSPIVRKLSKFYMDRNIRFGDIVWTVRPETLADWKKFLVSKSFYFPHEVKNMAVEKAERNEWIHYLIYSFWNLYSSEKFFLDKVKSMITEWNACHSQVEDGKLICSPDDVQRASFGLDHNFGIDFTLSAKRYCAGRVLDCRYFFIVKSTHTSPVSFLSSKPSYRFFKEFATGSLGEHVDKPPVGCPSKFKRASNACDFAGVCHHCSKSFSRCACHFGVKKVIGNFLYLVPECKPGQELKHFFEFDWADLTFKKQGIDDFFAHNLPLGEHRRLHNDK